MVAPSVFGRADDLIDSKRTVTTQDPEPRANPNRVRDHLANERTYLAWIRTAVALMGFGIVIVRLRHLDPTGNGHGWELGLLFAVVGLLMVALSTLHYFKLLRAIERDTYTPEGRWILILSIAVALIGAGVVYVLLTSPAPSSPGALSLP